MIPDIVTHLGCELEDNATLVIENDLSRQKHILKTSSVRTTRGQAPRNDNFLHMVGNRDIQTTTDVTLQAIML